MSVGHLDPRDPLGNPVVSQVPRYGSKAQLISQNFCDRHTWYSTSARRSAQTLTDTGDGLTWALASDKIGVDVSHGRLLHERRIHATYQPVVRVGGVVKTEVDAHTGVGDYVIDYATMRVTFTSSQAGAVVDMDFSEVVDSTWYLRPTPGKKLRLLSAELQFSTDARMADTFLFQPRGDVAKHAALAGLLNNPYPAGTMLPLGDPVAYQTVQDLIVEANVSYPQIPSLTGANPTWRDLQVPVLIFRWDYERQATIDITDAAGTMDPNDITVSLEHHVEMPGTMAIVTFYCLSEDL